MQPYIIKPGETVSGIGFDFLTRLADGETLISASASASTGLTVSEVAYLGTIASATIACAADQVDADLELVFTVTGTEGSIRKATRPMLVRAVSN